MENEQQQPCAAVSYGSDFAKALEDCQPRHEQQQRPYVLKRVPPELLQTKEEAYMPHFVSLGPLHYNHLQLQHLHRARRFKIKVAADVGADILNAVETKLSEPSVASLIKSFYGLDDASGLIENVAVDALFLLRFLHYLRLFSHSINTENQADEVLQNFSFLEAGLKCDVVMLENQLPFQALELVFQVAGQTLRLNNDPSPAPESAKDLAKNALRQLSPFMCHRYMHLNQLKSAGSSESTSDKAHHLLVMLYSAIAKVVSVVPPPADKGARHGLYIDTAVAAVLKFIGMEHPAKSDDDFKDKYNASALSRAGIKFRSTARGSSTGALKGIWFERSSSTLVMPTICISHKYTEALLLNLMALEFDGDSAAVTAATPVTQYVQFMDCLIDSAEDVAVLRKARVLRRDSIMLHDEQVAKMWDDLCRHSGQPEFSTVLKNMVNEALILNYYKSYIRGRWKEFHDAYLSRPWTVVALLVATIVLACDLIQTYCAFRSICTTKEERAADKQKPRRFLTSLL